MARCTSRAPESFMIKLFKLFTPEKNLSDIPSCFSGAAWRFIPLALPAAGLDAAGPSAANSASFRTARYAPEERPKEFHWVDWGERKKRPKGCEGTKQRIRENTATPLPSMVETIWWRPLNEKIK